MLPLPQRLLLLLPLRLQALLEVQRECQMVQALMVLTGVLGAAALQEIREAVATEAKMMTVQRKRHQLPLEEVVAAEMVDEML